MKSLYVLILFSLMQTSYSFGQNKIKSGKTNIANPHPDKLIGTCRLIEFADLESATSKWTYPFDKNPNDYITYTKSGIVNLNISTDTPMQT
jgi:hypothetical protein